MSTLRIEFPGGARTLDTQEEVSVGREGTIVLDLGKGREDPNLSAINYYLAARPYHFEVQVEFDKRPVDVYPLPMPTSNEHPDYQEVREGETGHFFWSTAEVVVHTENAHHVVRLVFEPDPPPPPSARQTGTVAAYDLDLNNRKHRMVVALCRDRLKRKGARALSYQDAAEILFRAGRPEDHDLMAHDYSTARNAVTVVADIECVIERPVLVERPGEVSASRITNAVDWLVTMGVVNKGLYRSVAYPPGIAVDDPFFA